jgi:hypothetical protein
VDVTPITVAVPELGTPEPEAPETETLAESK